VKRKYNFYLLNWEIKIKTIGPYRLTFSLHKFWYKNFEIHKKGSARIPEGMRNFGTNGNS
jgi:hypothetical protein